MFDVVERYGAIWIRRHGSNAAFPNLDAAGYVPAGRFRHHAKVPLEILLDNFIETEHTPLVHFFLGFAFDQIPDVDVQTTMGDDWVRVINSGPKRPLTRVLEKVVGIPNHAKLVVDWTTFFSPVYTLYHHYFYDEKKKQPVGYPLRSALFIVPSGPDRSDVMSFFFGSLTPWSKYGLGSLLWPPLLAAINLELKFDCRVVENIADKRTSLSGNRLGRFDKALVAARSRIDRIYRGKVEGFDASRTNAHSPTSPAPEMQ
jgi:vanillate O-demethylase monooxygenase subunit